MKIQVVLGGIRVIQKTKHDTTRRKESIERHYAVERGYAQQILASPKGSQERMRLFAEGYDAITHIINEYSPGGGETHYTDVVVAIIKQRLKPGSRVLDVGCASGNLVSELVVNGYEAHGIDVSGHLIAMAQSKVSTLGKTKSNSPISSLTPQSISTIALSWTM
jgi:2-polyprenyl-3-methyl-5-hydroxy-6-metoxy-1,4-benzoquinol methylase